MRARGAEIDAAVEAQALAAVLGSTRGLPITTGVAAMAVYSVFAPLLRPPAGTGNFQLMDSANRFLQSTTAQALITSYVKTPLQVATLGLDVLSHHLAAAGVPVERVRDSVNTYLMTITSGSSAHGGESPFHGRDSPSHAPSDPFASGGHDADADGAFNIGDYLGTGDRSSDGASFSMSDYLGTGDRSSDGRSGSEAALSIIPCECPGISRTTLVRESGGECKTTAAIRAPGQLLGWLSVLALPDDPILIANIQSLGLPIARGSPKGRPSNSSFTYAILTRNTPSSVIPPGMRVCHGILNRAVLTDDKAAATAWVLTGAFETIVRRPGVAHFPVTLLQGRDISSNDPVKILVEGMEVAKPIQRLIQTFRGNVHVCSCCAVHTRLSEIADGDGTVSTPASAAGAAAAKRKVRSVCVSARSLSFLLSSSFPLSLRYIYISRYPSLMLALPALSPFPSLLLFLPFISPSYQCYLICHSTLPLQRDGF